MALTVDEIAEILNSMRVENENNVENFEKVFEKTFYPHIDNTYGWR